MRTNLWRLSYVFALSGAVGCGGGDGEPSGPPASVPTSIAATPETAALFVGDTVRLNAEVRDQRSTTMTAVVAWSSLASGVAYVDDAGLVTAAGAGSARIVAQAGSAADSVEITVAALVPTTIVVSPESAALQAGDTVRLVADVRDQRDDTMTGVVISWSSLEPGVAEVDDVGLVRAVAAGEAVIVAEAGGVADSIQVAVDDEEPVPATIAVTPDSVELVVGDTLTLAAEIRDQHDMLIVGVAVSWSSLVPAVADVDDEGLVTAMAAGDAVLVAEVGDIADSVHVTVEEAPFPAKIVVTPDSVELEVTDTLRLSAEIRDQNDDVMAGVAISWSSLDPSIADVDDAGLVTAIAPGGAEIVAGAGDVADTVAVEVQPPAPATVVVTPEQRVLAAGDTVRLVAEVRDQRDSVMSVPVSWSTLDPTVASVDDAGLVTAVGQGVVEIVGQAGSVDGSAYVAVDLVPRFVKTLSSGFAHTCALDAGAAAYCWGGGGVGTGTASDIAESPTLVVGGYTFDQISAAGAHTCGLTTDARVFCWGDNIWGQVDGTPLTSTPTPTQVSLTGTPVQVAAGDEFSCALLDTGEAVCWGRNNEAQLGRGSTSATGMPAAVDGGVAFIQLGVGRAHACGLTAEGIVHCWGRNGYGQIGDGTETMATTPTPVSTTQRFLQVDAGNEGSCALSLSRRAVCWGWNGTTTAETLPTEIAGLADLVAVHPGHDFACALAEDGQAWCWGRNQHSVLGIGIDDDLFVTDVPMSVGGGHTFADLAPGSAVNCARTVADALYCWGSNYSGSLGIGSSSLELVPIEVSGGHSWSELDASPEFVCGLDTAGEAYCWGAGYPLGGPTAVGGDGPFHALSVGYQHACALDAEGSAHCWRNTQDAAGDPMPVAADSAFIDIVAGSEHTCALTASGVTYCWGRRDNGRLGDGQSVGTTGTPMPGALGVTLSSMSAAYQHSCGVDAVGAAYCWGFSFQALGTGNTLELVPAPVDGGLTFAQVSAGTNHTCGIAVGGAGYCWGSGTLGRLGRGSNSSSTTPVPMSGGLSFSTLAAGHEHSCGVAGGQVHCWGGGGSAILGTGDLGGSLVPVLVTLPVAADVTVGVGLLGSISAPTCARTTDGRAFCWGVNDRGQVGVPVTPRSSEPLAVLPF